MCQHNPKELKQILHIYFQPDLLLGRLVWELGWPEWAAVGMSRWNSGPRMWRRYQADLWGRRCRRMHSRGRHDLRRRHLLHTLQRLLLVLLVNEMRRRAIPRDLKTAKIRLKKKDRSLILLNFAASLLPWVLLEFLVVSVLPGPECVTRPVFSFSSFPSATWCTGQ